jgi:hypothetical protein
VKIGLVRDPTEGRANFEYTIDCPQNTHGFDAWPEALLQRHTSLILKHAPFKALHPVKFVIVTSPENAQPMPALPAPDLTKPSFVEAEFTTNSALESERHYDQS